MDCLWLLWSHFLWTSVCFSWHTGTYQQFLEQCPERDWFGAWWIWSLPGMRSAVSCSWAGATQLSQGLHGLCFTHGVTVGLIPWRDNAEGPR